LKFYIDTSDRRNEYVYKILTSKNLPCYVYLENINKVKNGDIIIFSPAKRFSVEEVMIFPKEITIYAGNTNDNILSIFNNKNINYVNLMKDEIFAINNARLTAQGLLAIILFSIEKSFKETKILFFGGGRITKASVPTLKSLGFKVDVASYSLLEYHNAHFYADNCYLKDEFISNLDKYDVIVNTRPVKFVNDKMIDKISENCYFIETASLNCLDSEKKYNFNYLLAPALPQRFTPYSAGKLIADRIIGDIND